MTSRQAKIQEDTHFRIMRILQDNPDLTQRELADKLGMSVRMYVRITKQI